MQLTAAICDDNTKDIELVLSYLRQYEIQTHSRITFALSAFTSPAELLAAKDQYFDLYFLDILMDGMTGIELAEAIRSAQPSPYDNCCIIFLTGSRDYALPAFSVHAMGYLTKPLDYTEFCNTLNTLIKWLAAPRRSLHHFSFRTSAGVDSTLLQDILYVEIMGHTPYYHLTGGIKRGSESRIAFSKIVQPLLDSGLFLFPHRSYVVNSLHIASFSVSELVLNDCSRIPISRTRFAQTKAQYMDFLMEDKSDGHSV